MAPKPPSPIGQIEPFRDPSPHEKKNVRGIPFGQELVDYFPERRVVYPLRAQDKWFGEGDEHLDEPLLPEGIIFAFVLMGCFLGSPAFYYTFGNELASGALVGLVVSLLIFGRMMPLYLNGIQRLTTKDKTTLVPVMGLTISHLIFFPLFTFLSTWVFGLSLGIAFGVVAITLLSELSFALLNFVTKKQKSDDKSTAKKENSVPKVRIDPRRLRLAELGKEIHELEKKRVDTLQLEQKLKQKREEFHRLEYEFAAENPNPFRSAPVRR